MKKIGLGILTVLIVLSVSGVATAMINMPVADKAKEKVIKSPIINVNGNDLALMPPALEKIVFIHHKKGFAKPDWAGKGKNSKCYDFLGKGVKWQEQPVSYVIDPDNADNLTESFVVNAISAGAEEWDIWTGSELFNDTYKIVHDGTWDNDSPDGRNELLFGDYSDPNVIAVTVIWGYFSGPPHSRKIIEFDVLFDTDFTWGDATSNPLAMDLQNIAVHELGHGVGLADIYETTCSEVTMYGYSGYGETTKRSLESPDITGIQTLYGI